MEKQRISWDRVLNNYIPLSVMLNTLPTKGNLVYEYNPFRNYRLTEDKFQYQGNYYTEKELEDKFGITLTQNKTSWVGVPNNQTDPILYEKGQLVDFITDELNFSLQHPVHIVPQYSYDGSVNLIINDGLNIPRIINSRFSATGKNTYEIIDRKGNTDTNIYDSGEQFDIDTSLYKIVDNIPKIEFLKTSSGGNLKVGNYHFYFKLADADGNETDFVAESGLVSVFIGEGSYGSVHSGTKNENSTKQIEFGISNIDSAYDYIIVYYSRDTAELNDNRVTEYIKIDKKFGKTNRKLVITGFENTIEVTAADINLQYNVVSSAYTSAVCQNMLFMGNVRKQDIPYEELSDLSLRILPFLKTEPYDPELDQDYNSGNPKKSYINANYIYNKTGYWPGELYRFGIVYILPNGQLTPVFNIRGAYEIGLKKGFSYIPLKNETEERQYVKYDDNTFLITENTEYYIDNKAEKVSSESINRYSFENAKGVCSFVKDSTDLSDKEYPDIYSVNFYISEEVKKELKKYIKGYFFVRQPRIPLKLAQGITIGIDNEARTPTIPTAGGVLERLSDSLDKTHVETENINGLNYISEGFLRRYTFTFKKKSSSIWGKIGKIAGITAMVAGIAAAAVFLTPAGATALGTIAGKITAVSLTYEMAVAAAAAAGGIAGGIAGAVSGTVVASTQELGLAVARIGEKKRLNGKATVAPSGYKIEETSESRQLTENFDERIIIKDETKNSVQGIICPDYTVNQPFYNQIFTGNEHYIETDIRQSAMIEEYSGDSFFTNEDRHFYIEKYTKFPNKSFLTTKIIAVPDNITCTGIDNILFRSRAGEAEEAWRYKCIGEEITNVSEDNYQKINSDIVRGSFGPYLGITKEGIGPAKIVNIYIPGYNPSNIQEYIDIRMSDNSSYSAITDRFSIKDFESKLIGDLNGDDTWCSAYRGDCYICQFTQRINRNFNDPSAPYNDDIVDENTWRDNYDPENVEKYEQINLGDVNAVPLGMWLTFQLRSSNNLNIRTLDGSNVDETAMTGHSAGYYPVQPMSTEGTYKKAESQIYNKGFAKSLSDRWNIELPDVPHIKNWFGTRIMYSDIHITDAYKNGFRVFKGTNYRDYTREYGEIVKLVPFESSLLCVFEHGIAMIPVNERAVAGQGAGGNVYINTFNVLPENPKIISDMFGSQWAESILKVPGRTGDAPQYVYGVDTVAKKIWRTDGTSIECISDFRVQEFLNNNITLGERELTPRIGIRNVKTHYNAYKRDVMFTFYDNTYGFEEKVWNLCWNELLQKFITFYSWVPSYMENINNVPFSFNRDTSKWVAKLGTSHTENSFADGITLSNVITKDRLDPDDLVVDDYDFNITYITKEGLEKTVTYTVASDSRAKFIGVLSLSNRVLPNSQIFYDISYSLERDNLLNYKKFRIGTVDVEGEYTSGGIILPEDAMYSGQKVSVYALYFNTGKEEYQKVYYMDNSTGGFLEVLDSNGDNIYTYTNMYSTEALLSELYYRNSAGNVYADIDDHKVGTKQLTTNQVEDRWFKDVDTMYEIIAELPPETIVGNSNGYDVNGNPTGRVYPCTTVGKIADILYYNNQGQPMVHGIPLSHHWTMKEAVTEVTQKVHFDLPIFKDLSGKRLTLPKEEQINPDKLVTLLNIKAKINIIDQQNSAKLGDDYYNLKAGFSAGTQLVDAGYYESTVAIAPKWNLQFLSTDFWKHGQAGIIDIADDIYPTYWYGKQHPFEFEVVVVNDPSIHKIFQNLELVANKAKPESFHYEIIGESYDFAKDKVNMYFRQEALKALWQYNGADICYDRNFLKVQTRQQAKSADLPHRYYTRQDTVNDIEDYYISATYPVGYDYRHLSGGEIVYYPTRQEYRIWNHAKAVSLDDLSQDDSRSIIAANCQYLEDRWKVTINPILICYKNEYSKKYSGALIQPANSNWVDSVAGDKLPPFAIYNSPIPDKILASGSIEFPDPTTGEGRDSALYNLYKNPGASIDTSNWLKDVGIYNTQFGEAQNRKELDLKDKFIKIRIRYSGEELAVIDFLNTVYRISYA